MITITRRLFLRGLISVPIAVGLPHLLEARTLHRQPYVRPGQVVDYIGLNLHPSPTFIGGAIVGEVGDWDGEAYPCRLVFGYGRHQEVMTFPDHDLALLREDVPRQFWGIPGNNERWPNVHAYVRWNRFGEDPAVMRARMNAARHGLPWPHRAVAKVPA